MPLEPERISKALPSVSESAPVPPVRLGRVLRAGLREVWDRLGLVVGVSLTWMLLLSLLLSLARLLPPTLPVAARNSVFALWAALLLSAPTAGAFHVAHLVFAREEVAYADFWRGARRLVGPATRLGLLHLAALTIFAANLWFYLRLGNLVGILAGLLCLYLLLFWGMMALYHFPLLVAQEAGLFDEPERRAKRGAFAVLRRAFFLTLGEPFFSLGLFAVTALLIVAMGATVVLPPLLGMGTLALLLTPATRALLVKYGVLPLPVVEEPIPDEKFRIADAPKPPPEN